MISVNAARFSHNCRHQCRQRQGYRSRHSQCYAEITCFGDLPCRRLNNLHDWNDACGRRITGRQRSASCAVRWIADSEQRRCGNARAVPHMTMTSMQPWTYGHGRTQCVCPWSGQERKPSSQCFQAKIDKVENNKVLNTTRVLSRITNRVPVQGFCS